MKALAFLAAALMLGVGSAGCLEPGFRIIEREPPKIPIDPPTLKGCDCLDVESFRQGNHTHIQFESQRQLPPGLFMVLFPFDPPRQSYGFSSDVVVRAETGYILGQVPHPVQVDETHPGGGLDTGDRSFKLHDVASDGTTFRENLGRAGGTTVAEFTAMMSMVAATEPWSLAMNVSYQTQAYAGVEPVFTFLAGVEFQSYTTDEWQAMGGQLTLETDGGWLHVELVPQGGPDMDDEDIGTYAIRLANSFTEVGSIGMNGNSPTGSPTHFGTYRAGFGEAVISIKGYPAHGRILVFIGSSKTPLIAHLDPAGGYVERRI